MHILHSIIGIPSRILSLEQFGVGTFTKQEITDKCELIKLIMQSRMKSDHPYISVVIPAHREGHYILATLRSLAEQTFQDCEFLIVVNGEQRGGETERIARRSGFRVIHEQRAGIGRARQIGLLKAKGEIIVTTDADTLHHRRWLETIADTCQKNPSLVAGFGWMRALSPSYVHQVCLQLHSAWRSFQGRYLFFNASEANSFYRRSAALSVGGYDMNCNYCEGSQLFHKLTELGDVHGITDAEATIFTSDRRNISDRLQTFLHYLFSASSAAVRYGVVR